MLDIEQLGFTKEELQQRVVDQICEQLLTSTYTNEDGDESPAASQFQRAISSAVKKQTDETINALAERHLLPKVANQIETIVLEETNRWGEKKGNPVSFIEYLTQRAEAYIQEKVDSDGKTEKENTYNWSGKQTRITHLIHSHLHYSIKTAMEEALKVGIGEVAKGIHETARLKLNEIAAGMKVSVTTK